MAASWPSLAAELQEKILLLLLPQER